MKKIFLVVSLLLYLTTTYGQRVSDSIQIRKSLGTSFYQNGKKLSSKQLMEITRSNPEAFKIMKTAKGSASVGSVLGFVGGFMIGWPIGQSIAGNKETNWAIAGIGAGLVGISIPVNMAYNKQATKAAILYNKGIRQTSTRRINMKLLFAGNRAGISVGI